MPVPRVVLDANVFVSALLGKGVSSKIYDAFKECKFELVCSKSLLSELAEVLIRPSLGLDPSEIKLLFRLLRYRATIVRPTHRIEACRDPKDNVVLECALSGHAAWIVTGDKDLLVLNPFHEIRIASPTSFFDHLSKL